MARLWWRVLAAAAVAAPAAGSSVDGVAGGRLRGGAADLTKPMPIISSAGEFLPSSAAAVEQVSGPRSVVATVGGRLRARRLLNAVFSTSFDTALAPADDAGAAYVAVPAKAPQLLIVHTEAGASAAAEGSAVADECALGSFALSLADAVLMLPPCAQPTKAILMSMYELVFAQHLACTQAEAAPAAAGKPSRTLLVHIAHSPADEAAVRAAAQAAWAAAAAATSGAAANSFSSRFELITLALPPKVRLPPPPPLYSPRPIRRWLAQQPRLFIHWTRTRYT